MLDHLVRHSRLVIPKVIGLGAGHHSGSVPDQSSAEAFEAAGAYRGQSHRVLSVRNALPLHSHLMGLTVSNNSPLERASLTRTARACARGGVTERDLRKINPNPVFGLAAAALSRCATLDCAAFNGAERDRAAASAVMDRSAAPHNYLNARDVAAIKQYLRDQGAPEDMIEAHLVCYPDAQRCAQVRLFRPAGAPWSMIKAGAAGLAQSLGFRVKACAGMDYVTVAKAHKGDALVDFAHRSGLSVDEIVKFGDAAEGVDRELLVGPHAYDVSPQAGQGASGFKRVLEIIEATPQLKAIATDYDGTLADGYLSPPMAQTLEALLARGVKVAIITANAPENILYSLSDSLQPEALSDKHCEHLCVYFYNGNERWDGYAVRQGLRELARTGQSAAMQ